MSEELAEALNATNSEEDLRRFEELMSRDVEPESSFEEFCDEYTPTGSDSSDSLPHDEGFERKRCRSNNQYFNINIFIEDDDESQLVL